MDNHFQYIYNITNSIRNLNQKDKNLLFPLSEPNFQSIIKKRLDLINNDFNHLFSLSNLNEKDFYSLLNIRSAIEDVKSIYSLLNNTSYNQDNINKIKNSIENKKMNENSVLVTMTTCKRLDLFTRTINSFINNCLDLSDYIYDWYIIDDNSSDEDIEFIKNNYPFIKIIRKTENERGHARSMNMIRNLIINKIKTPYYLHLEDDFDFVIQDNYIKKSIHIMKEDDSIKQVMFNLNYIEDFSVTNNTRGSTLKYTNDSQRYFIHNYIPRSETDRLKINYPNCHYWPHFSFRAGLNKTELLELGEFIETPCHFEMEYAFKYMNKGYKTAFLDGINYYHIGRRTYERNDNNKTNAYELNNQTQFGQKLKSKEENKKEENKKEENKKEENKKEENKKEEIKKEEIKKEEKEEEEKEEIKKEEEKEEKEEEGEINLTKSGKIDIKKTFNIKSYVINLEKRPIRLYNFMSNLKDINYVNVFDGIDGKKLQPCHKIAKLFEKSDYNYRRGIVGCALSHMLIWKEFLNDVNVQYLLVFEDDSRLVDNFNQKLLHLLNTYENNFDVLYLGMFPYKHKDKLEWHYTNIQNKNLLPNAKRLFKNECFETSMGGNHGYVLTKKGAYNCLEYIRKNGMPNAIDWMVMHTAGMSEKDKSENINRIYYSYPFLVEANCYQTKECETDIQLEYDIVKYEENEWLESEIKYWNELSINDSKYKLIETNINDIIENNLLDKQVSLVDYNDFISNKDKIINKPVQYYTVENKKVFIVPDYFINKKILQDITFNGYLNTLKIF